MINIIQIISKTDNLFSRTVLNGKPSYLRVMAIAIIDGKATYLTLDRESKLVEADGIIGYVFTSSQKFEICAQPVFYDDLGYSSNVFLPLDELSKKEQENLI